MSLYTMPCVIFAGGKSSRMGKDKAFLPFGGCDSLIQFQVQRLKKIFANVYISAKDKTKFSGIDALVIEDILHPEISAPTTGFINIFKQLKTKDSFFILSVDTPLVDEKTISKLLEVSTSEYEAIILRTHSGIHPLCGIYTRALEEPIKMMMQKGDHKLRKLLASANVYYVDINEENLLSNLNTPQEYEKAVQNLEK
ncbi:MAG: molybdenum cofactor guanylyltransferase [Arcobacter sp.]|nr:MAG: molybdenum cofactor guanylyltransferase [Arcobacter sp.]